MHLSQDSDQNFLINLVIVAFAMWCIHPYVVMLLMAIHKAFQVLNKVLHGNH